MKVSQEKLDQLTVLVYHDWCYLNNKKPLSGDSIREFNIYMGERLAGAFKIPLEQVTLKKYFEEDKE